jgi:sugar phosphate isomerase/epimerase
VEMQLGLFSWYGFEAPLYSRLKRIKKAGFASTMLWWGDNESPDPQIDADLFRKAKELDLKIENIHVPYTDANRLWATDHNVHKSYLPRYLRYIDFSSKHGIPTIVMHISSGYLVEQPNGFGIDTLRRLSTYALRAGVSIAIENTRNVSLVVALLEGIDNKNLGLCYDTSHGWLYEGAEFYLLKKYPYRLKCLHISDNDGLEDRHWNINEGVIDWNAFAQSVPIGSECQTLSLEVYPRNGNVHEEDFLREAYTRACNLRDLLNNRTS